MKILGLLWIMLLVCTQAGAQPGAEPASIPLERARISAQRERELARYALEEQACATKFLTNDCVAGVKKRQRDTLAELQRQDIALNDAERRRKAAELLAQPRRRASGVAASAVGAASAAGPVADRRKIDAQDKALGQQQGADAAHARAQVQERKLQQHGANSDAAAQAKAALATKNKRANEQRKAQAAQHRQDMVQRQMAKTKPQSLPLPDPQ